jgi:heme/copper-type cytochrome/quinol oxidase subunit 2
MMKKSTKILLAIATIWPFIYMIFFFVVIFFSFFFMPRGGTAEGGAFPALFMIIFPLHFLTMLLIMGLTVFYMVNVFRNDRVEKDKKVLWAVVLFMGNMIAMPIYWYLYIWRDEKEPPVVFP